MALLTNSLSPHTLPLSEALSQRVRHFRAILSADCDAYHGFPKLHAGFEVVVQRSFNALRLLRRSYGFWKADTLHIPYDTFQQLQAYQPDIMLSAQFGIRTLLAVLYRMRRPRTRLVLWAALSSHTEQQRAWYRRVLRRWMVRHIDAAFVNGVSGGEYLHSTGFRGPVFTIPYTIDDSLFRSAAYAPQPGILRLLYCGRVDPGKGIRAFCEVLAGWCADHPTRQVRLEIVGDGSDVNAISVLRTPENLELRLHPRMDQADLARHYAKVDMFVFPSLGDEWGVVVNEAMSAGLPVLGSVFSQAVVELIREGDGGWIFDASSRASSYAALDRALNTPPAELQEMSLRVRQEIASLSPHFVAARAVEALQFVATIAPALRRQNASRTATATP